MTPKLPKDFSGQFKLTPLGGQLADASNYLELGAFCLSWVSPSRAVRVVEKSGRTVGALFGLPVDYLNKKVVIDDLLCETNISEVGIDRFVEDSIYRLSGSFLFVLDCSEGRRVYLDADGTMSAVWESEKHSVAATAGLLLDAAEYADRFDEELYRYLDVKKEGWFPAGLTAHHGVHRILVNHYLDLETWTQHRHWPQSQIPTSSDPEGTCRQIADITRATIDTLRRSGTVSLTLTAGNETRLLLACCKDFFDDLEFVTVVGQETRLDAVRAKELAKKFGLKHRLLDIVYADADGQEDWHARTGHCLGGVNMKSYPSVLPMSERSFFLIGLGGEIGRAFFWNSGDAPGVDLTVESISRRMGMPEHKRVLDAIEAWRPSIDGFDVFLQLDLAYLELRMGCWAYAQAYSHPKVMEISPMICREVFAHMLSLPPEWRRQNRVILEPIEQIWPQLLELPINEYGDYRDYVRKIGRAVRNPHIVMSKLRKLRG